MNIQIGYNFKPFDMTPILNAMNQYNTQYEKEQQIYDTISQKLGNLSSAVQGTTQAKDIYDNYMQGLEQATTNFSVGRNSNTARELSALRKAYATDIIKLEQARESMLSNNKMQQTMSMQDPSMIFQSVGNMDTYLNNPTYTPKGFSGDKLSAKVQSLVQSMFRDISTMEIDKKNLDKYHKQIVTRTGLDSQTAKEAIEAIASGKPIPNETLAKIHRTVFDQTGVADWGDKVAIDRTNEAIANGIQLGVGQVNRQVIQDIEATKALDWEYDKKKLLLSAALSGRGSGRGGGSGGSYYGPNGGYTGVNMPSNTHGVHFKSGKDPQQLKKEMAHSTWNYMQYKANKGDKKAKGIIDYWTKNGGQTAAENKWATKGFDGNAIPSYLRQGLLGHLMNSTNAPGVQRYGEDVAKIWVSGYTPGQAISAMNVAYPDVKSGGVIQMPQEAKNGKVSSYKEWRNFDKLAQQGTSYEMSAANVPIVGNQVGVIMQQLVKNKSNNNSIPLHDVTKIDAKGNITVSKNGTNMDELPKDLRQVTLGVYGNYFTVTYKNPKTNTTETKVVNPSDFGNEASTVMFNIKRGQESLENELRNNRITKADYEAQLQSMINLELNNLVMLGAEVKVDPYRIVPWEQSQTYQGYTQQYGLDDSFFSNE